MDDKIIKDVCNRENQTCFYCGEPTPLDKGMPHRVVPKALGGGSNKGNLIWSCKNCSPRIKGEMRMQQGIMYLRRIGELMPVIPKEIK